MIRSSYGSLRELFEQLYQPRRLMTAAQTTPRKYMITIRAFGRFLGREPQLMDLDEDRIAQFLADYSQGRASDTTWTARKHLLALSRFAQSKGLIAEVPDVSQVRRCKRSPVAYSIDEVARLLAAARELPGSVAGVPASLFFQALFLVAYDTGARAGAIWSLRWCDYLPPYLVFRAETQKQAADQVLRISPQTQAELSAIQEPRRELIFFWQLSSRTRDNRVKEIFKAAGLPHGRRDMLQRIRRSTATIMHARGGDATQQLGHSSSATTIAHYLDPSCRVQAADILPRPIIPPSDPQRRLF